MYFSGEGPQTFIKVLKENYNPRRLRTTDLDEDTDCKLVIFTGDTKLPEREKTVNDKSGLEKYLERLNEQAESSKITWLREDCEKDLEDLTNSKLSMSH